MLKHFTVLGADTAATAQLIDHVPLLPKSWIRLDYFSGEEIKTKSRLDPFCVVFLRVFIYFNCYRA